MKPDDYGLREYSLVSLVDSKGAIECGLCVNCSFWDLRDTGPKDSKILQAN